MNTLVVIDMQSRFKAANYPNALITVTKEIIHAKQQERPIVFVEYNGFGQTHKELLSLVKDYPLKSIIKKKCDDGSKPLMKALKKHKFYTNLRVCGVNADLCVAATVKGCLKYEEVGLIEVVKQGCAWIGNFTWRNYFRHPSLKLV
jgi:nicotinamidase-related amidase